MLYLLCYISNVREVTDIDKIVNVLKRLKKEVSFEDDIMYNQFCTVNEESHIKSEYGEDFNIRYELYYYSINFDEQSMDINCYLGFKRHKKMLKDLYRICLIYCIVVGEMDEVSKKMERVRSQQKSGEVRKPPKARRTGADMETQIRENIFSYIRNKIIKFGTADE